LFNLLAGGFGAGSNPFNGLLKRYRLRLDVLGDGGVDLALIDIGAIAASANGDRTVFMLEGLNSRHRAGALEAASGLLRQQIDGAIEANGEQLFDVWKIGVFAVAQ